MATDADTTAAGADEPTALAGDAPLYLAGDTENAPEWIEANADNVFLDETDEWGSAMPGRRFLDNANDFTTPELGPHVPGSESEFQAMPWTQLEELSAACASEGAGAYRGLLGYTKPVVVTDVGTVTVRLIGLCHDTYSDGSGTAGFTFQLQDGLSTTKPALMRFDVDPGEDCLWGTSEIRNVSLPKLKAALPDDLRAVIKKVRKKTGVATGGSYDAPGLEPTETDEDLFLLSMVESIGTTKTSYGDNPMEYAAFLPKEGSQYEYYALHDTGKTDACTHHVIRDDSGMAQGWWTRSSIGMGYPSMNSYMTDEGDWSFQNYIDEPYLPAAAFCI